MNEFLSNLLVAVLTAAVPVITAYGVSLIKKAAEYAAANTESTKAQGYIKEIMEAVSEAVAATSQTYVDALKNAGNFTPEAQKKAAQKALAACLASISPSAQAFAEKTYGDLTEYLTTKIEAEVRKQKNEAPATLALPVLDSTTDTRAVAASTAAATAATIAQAAIQQLAPEPLAPEQTV